jgi:hypothetical protein
MGDKHAPGVIAGDPSRPGLASLPYELQAAVFEATIRPQIFFLQITNDVLTFSRSADRGIGSACRLSREIYIKSKTLCKFGCNFHWVNPDNDIFYLYKDDGVRYGVRNPESMTRPPKGDSFEPSLLRNIAVDLQYLGVHPRHEAANRVWSIFPSLKTLHVFVPSGPPQTPALSVTPEALVLSELRGALVVAAPGLDKELWSAVKYQLKRTFDRILDARNGWNGRVKPDVVGHLTSARPKIEEADTENPEPIEPLLTRES